MKIAKKVLAIAVAVGMIFCLTAMAFANDGYTCEAKASDVVDGKFTVSFIVDNAAGWTSTQVPVEYDANVLSVNAKTGSKLGGWSKAYEEIGESTISAFNAETAGTVIPGITTANSIMSDADYKAACAEAEVDPDTSFTTDALVLFTITFKVTDATATKTTITWGDATVTVKLADEPETEATTEPTTAASGTDGEITTADNGNNGDADAEATTNAANAATGTNGNAATGTVATGYEAPLAAAAAVCALAAAAFVVTKKVK